MFDLLDWQLKVNKIFNLGQKSITFLKKATGYVFDLICMKIIPSLFLYI